MERATVERVRLTRRGETVVGWLAVTAFLMILGFCGWIEGLGP